MRVQCFMRTLLAAMTFGAGGSIAAAADETVAPDLGWLRGCWVHENGRTEEHWIDAGHGLFFGHSVTIRDGRLAAFEDLRIEPRAHGPVYTASPGGRTPVSFQYADSGDTSVEFDNADHDFPQRIAYVREGDRLTASISTLDGEERIDFLMTPCEASRTEQVEDGER